MSQLTGPENIDRVDGDSIDQAYERLSLLGRSKVHTEGWAQMNRRYHNELYQHRLVALRLFSDDEERADYLDGVTISLMIRANIEDCKISEEDLDTILAMPGAKLIDDALTRIWSSTDHDIAI